MASVILKQVNKSFGTTPVVRGIDLAVASGELLVVVGPSGCGKSTVLRLIAGLEECDSGEIWIGDRRVDQLEPRARDVAMVFQNYALYPHMTVASNLGFPLKMAGVSRSEIAGRVAEITAALGISDLLDRKPRTLSGGQMQRVALGRAMIRKPAVFLFDEPLSNLDARLRLEMRAEIARLHRQLGTTMIYVTHDQSEAMTLGQRIAVLNNGGLEQLGPPLDLYRHPQTRFVAGFIGTPPMNFLGDVGIRPHEIVVADDGPIDAEIELVEPLGSDVHVHCIVDGQRLLVVMPHAPKSARLKLRFPEDKLHRFS